MVTEEANSNTEGVNATGDQLLLRVGGNGQPESDRCVLPGLRLTVNDLAAPKRCGPKRPALPARKTETNAAPTQGYCQRAKRKLIGDSLCSGVCAARALLMRLTLKTLPGGRKPSKVRSDVVTIALNCPPITGE